jgi:capsular polysaccharide biosynthesis protein
MNRTLRSMGFLWGRRLGIPLIKAMRQPFVGRMIRGVQSAVQPGLSPTRLPPNQVQSLRDYVAKEPARALPIPGSNNPHHEVAALLADGRVAGESGQICLPDCLLSDVSFEWFMEPRQLSLLYRWSLPPITPVSGRGTSIAVISGHCYYHWLFNSLPRLGILEAAGIRLADLDYIITNPLRHRFQRESLEMLGIDVSRVRETAVQRTYLADQLLLTTIPGFISGFHHEFLNQRLAPPPAKPPHRALYLARGGSRHRQVVNEPEVIEALAQVGIVACHPETLSLREQIQLFQEAKSVVAPHGAALANLVFCRSGTPVAEIFSPHYFNDCYQTLAREAGLRHFSLTHQPGVTLISDHRYVEEPMRIDIGHLMNQIHDSGVI